MKLKYHIFSLFYLLLPGVFMIFLWSCKEEAIPVESIDARKLFAFQVYPLLESKCFACHGEDPEEIEGKFDIRSLEGMLKGGESGKPAILPGYPLRSPLFLAVKRLDEDFAMPPKENDQLDDEQIDWLKQWIAAGAPWPDEPKRKVLIAAGGWDYKGKIRVKTSGGLSSSWTNRSYRADDLWAFQPVKEVEIPKNNGQPPKNPIDAFINQKLEQYRLPPAPKADKRTLIRRATFDLLGLPPTIEEISRFLADDTSDAFEKVIERLLASPHYGEQWGRHWLDVVRYADSDGFANDYMRPNAWRYRDYVIRSFNEDIPYNQFVKEQIAGDEIDPDQVENLIATGFLRMGPWEHTGMSVKAETRQYFLDDISNSVGEVFLSQPLRCARCHDHKFDPIPTRDVYAVQAVFATTQFAERPAPFLASENLDLFNKEKDRVLATIDKARTERQLINEKEEAAARKWYKERGKKYVERRTRRNLPEDQKPEIYTGLSFQELGYRKLLDKRIQRFNREKAAFDSLAYSVYNGPPRLVHSARTPEIPDKLEGELEETFILSGGSVYAKGDRVAPGVLSALAGFQTPPTEQNARSSLDVTIPWSMDKRRLAFANWLVHPDNPLTTRSIVNRIWQYHFGKGIAENSNNFGITGKKPTHLELLDWLTQYFINNGWSIKTLHRLILTSEAWQRSNQHPDMTQVQRLDPSNKYLAAFSPRRLAAEEIRDAILHASKELNKEMGGLPVRPEIHLEVALQPRQIMGSVAPAYQPSPTRAERNRRTIYALKPRGFGDPFLEVFNRPRSELSCENRSTSSVTPQVFMLFNDKNIRDRAVALAQKIAQTTQDQRERIAATFYTIYTRTPKEKELTEAVYYLAEMTRYHQENNIPKEAYPKSVKREMFEEMTGKTFSFEEPLEVYDNYEPDLKMWEVPPTTRALADLAVVLFNSNEFMYIY